LLILFFFRLRLDGDKLYGGVKKLIAEHLDDLASREIVPTFPRSGVMSSNLTMASSSKSMGMESLNLEDTGNVKVGSVNAQSVEMVLEGERFLKALKSVWEDHISSMSKLRQILKYMVRHDDLTMRS
jgi:cullin 3